MYCGHCGAVVEAHDQFCRSCGARFVDAAPPGALGGAATGALGGAALGGAVGGAAMPPPGGEPALLAPPPPGSPPADEPTRLIPVTPGPGAPGPRPYLIAAAFTLLVIGGIVAFFLLRGPGGDVQPAPTGPTTPVTVTPTSTTNPLPPVATTAPVTSAPTTATTVPPTTAAPTAPPTTAPSNGTVPANTATIPGATPTTAPATTVARAPAPAPAPATTAAPTKPVPVSGSSTVTAVRASAVRASGVDSCGQPTSYSPANVLDGQPATAWMTLGDGAGQYLEFTVAPGAQLTQVGLIPGYAKQDPCSGADRFHDMRRITQVRWTFDGGKAVNQTLDPESATMQTLQLPSAIKAGKVRLTILTTTEPGTAGLDYSPISEVTLA